MPCVMITALGALVEPDVNMNLAMVSRVMASCAASTAGVASVASSALNGVAVRPGSVPSISATSTSAPTVALMAAA